MRLQCHIILVAHRSFSSAHIRTVLVCISFKYFPLHKYSPCNVCYLVRQNFLMLYGAFLLKHFSYDHLPITRILPRLVVCPPVEFCENSGLMAAFESRTLTFQLGWDFWLQSMRFSRPLKSRSAKSAKVSRHKPDVKNVIRVAFRFNIGDLVYHHKNTKMWGQIVGRGRFGEPLEGSALLQQKWTKERVRDSPTASPNW